MCGIFGIVTDKEQPLGEVLTDAGRRLSYRGYDSVGAATIHADGVIDLRKDVGKVDVVSLRHDFASMRVYDGGATFSIRHVANGTYVVPEGTPAKGEINATGKVLKHEVEADLVAHLGGSAST